MKKDIYTSCSKCIDGVETISSLVEGETVHEEIECRTCGGSSKVSHLFLSEDLITLLEDMNDRINDIFEKVNE